MPDIEVLQDLPDDIKANTDTSTEGEASLRGHLLGPRRQRAGRIAILHPAGFEVLFSSSHSLRERLLALVALDIGNTLLDASPNTTPTSFLASAIFLYISRAGFANLGDPRQPCLTRVGKFCRVCFNTVSNAALAGLNSSTFCLDVGHTDSN